MVYINIKDKNGVVETIDEFKTYKEGREMLKEYKYSGNNGYYISQRSTKEWRKRGMK